MGAGGGVFGAGGGDLGVPVVAPPVVASPVVEPPASSPNSSSRVWPSASRLSGSEGYAELFLEKCPDVAVYPSRKRMFWSGYEVLV